MKTYTKGEVISLLRSILYDADSIINIDLEDGYVEIREEEFEDWCKKNKI